MNKLERRWNEAEIFLRENLRKEKDANDLMSNPKFIHVLKSTFHLGAAGMLYVLKDNMSEGISNAQFISRLMEIEDYIEEVMKPKE